MEQRIRISLFIDGGYDAKVNRYYSEIHPVQSSLSFSGLKRFALKQVATHKRVPESSCKLIEGHYFRGRYRTDDAIARGTIEGDRRLEDALFQADITPHYLPIKKREKGIDSLLGLTGYKLVRDGGVDVIVLMAGDGDHVTMAHEVTNAGGEILLLGWSFKYTDSSGKFITHARRPAYAGPSRGRW